MTTPKAAGIQFEVGQIVHHRRYGYRGVIFDFDRVCRADDDWYDGNQSQPPRDQPWYHVLVDGAIHTTYVAESNLEASVDASPIRHPLLNRLFASYYQGAYYRYCLN